MKKSLLLVFLSILYSFSALGQDVRKGIFHTSEPKRTTSEQYSFLTLGTMFGLSFALKEQNTYKVVDGIVKYDRKGETVDQLLPSVYAFPSINLIGVPGNSLSMIVPVNINPSDVAVGIGVSYGFNVKKTIEIGGSILAIWSNFQELNEEQKISLNTQQPLQSGESSVFGTHKQVSIGLGIYIAPLIKTD